MSDLKPVPKSVLTEITKIQKRFAFVLCLDRVNAYTEFQTDDQSYFDALIQTWWNKNKDCLQRSEFRLFSYEFGMNLHEIFVDKSKKQLRIFDRKWFPEHSKTKLKSNKKSSLLPNGKPNPKPNGKPNPRRK